MSSFLTRAGVARLAAAVALLLTVCSQVRAQPVAASTAALVPANAVEPIGGAGAPRVSIPRVEGEIALDGRLDEPAWQQAVRLGGFSQLRPVDSRAAEENTQVLVWYSPSALYIGIVAFDREPGSIRATVADRDKLERDDNVTIYLDTFLDRRRAFFFSVNPLGAQADGVYSEGQFNPGTMMGGSTDYNPDYLFDSKGQLTADGYVVEIRIPFKSLRYPSAREQRWGFNVLRKVQRTGYEDTWTDAKRAASFLAQAGVLEGIHDVKRGVVTEVQPFVTATANGVARADGSDFMRLPIDGETGANVRLGFTNLAIDATVNPDFSQVESDVGQVTVNERFALFYPEKRPFFLEGIELFATPNQLVYTRQIVNPIAGGKVTGKVGRLGIAYLSAPDDTDAGNAWFNIARIRTDFGANSVAGVTFTDRTLDGTFNRVAAADARYVFGKLYYLQGQLGGSWTETGTARVAAPIWLAEFDRTGRTWGWNYRVSGIGEGFEARSGFVPRNDIIDAHAMNRYTVYGKRGAALENLTTFGGISRLWEYRGGMGHSPIEGNERIETTAQFRGGWTVNPELTRSFFVLDPRAYEGYFIDSPDGGLEAYQAPGRLDGLWALSISGSTPTWQGVNASLRVERGETPVFDEGGEGRGTTATAGAALRPTSSLRVEVSSTFAQLRRARDDSEFARTLLPRVKFEYQPKRSLFFRFVTEYRAERIAALQDAVTGAPLYRDGLPVAAEQSNTLRLDWLVSFEPSPGTVAYFGYGSMLETPVASRWSEFRRNSDGFFVKLAYLFRR